MITSVRMVNFKNFADETLKAGPFTIIVGANASGKSNIRDAFRFLHGIGRGYTLAEIMGGKHGPGGQLEWEPIRGAPNGIERFRGTPPRPFSKFSVHTELDLEGERSLYSISLGRDQVYPEGFRVLEESLEGESTAAFVSVDEDPFPMSPLISLRGGIAEGLIDMDQDANRGHRFEATLPRSQPVLTQLLRVAMPSQAPSINAVHYALGGMRFLEPLPRLMKKPSFPGATTLGDSGENLPTVLEAICADSLRQRTLMSWLQELTPMDVTDLDFPRDPSGRVYLDLVEQGGRKVSADSASDGTLRFLCILAALLGRNEAGLYFFEEIDNGIHPNRLWLLLDLIEQQTAEGNVQVVTTTHSPAMLAWMSDTAFEHTSVVYRDEYRADSVIRPIAELHNLRELRESRGLERLLTSGWFETAMKFSEGDPDTDHLDDDEDTREQEILP